MTVLLEVDSLVKKFGGVTAVNDVSFPVLSRLGIRPQSAESSPARLAQHRAELSNAGRKAAS